MIEPTCTNPHVPYPGAGQCGACIQIRVRKFLDNHSSTCLDNDVDRFKFQMDMLDYVFAELSREVTAIEDGTR